MSSKAPMEALVRIVKPFLERHGKMYIASGCGRVYFGRIPSEGCSVCDQQHENHEVSSLDDLKTLDH